MLKSAILCVLLWHAMCEFSTRAHPGLTVTHIVNFPGRVSSKINDTDVQIEPKGNYYFNITTININAPLFGTTASTSESPTACAMASTTNERQISPGKGYVVTKGIGAHKLHYKDRTWNEAREICINEGGDLVVITSYLESKIVWNMMQDSGLVRAWIGFRNRFGEEDWISVFNDTLGENGWMHWYTMANTGERNQCAVYYVQNNPSPSGMIAHHCVSNYKFICKITTI